MRRIVLAIILIGALPNLVLSFDMKGYLEEYLRKEFGFEEIYVGNIKMKENLVKPPESIKIEKFVGRLLKLSAISDGKVIDGTAEVRAYNRIFVTKSFVEKGKELTSDDVVETMVEYSKTPKGAVTELSSIVGKTAKSSLRPNTVITNDRLVVVKKGESVYIKIEKPSFSIKMIGKALEDGFVGNVISVLNVTSNKVIKGVVNEDKTVSVLF